MLKTTIAFTAIIMLSGCSQLIKNPPEYAEGSKLPEDYKETIKSEVSADLTDPYSAMYDFDTPLEGGCYYNFKKYSGWIVPFTVNSKNRYGGYAGKRSLVYLVNNKNALNFTQEYSVGGCTFSK